MIIQLPHPLPNLSDKPLLTLPRRLSAVRRITRGPDGEIQSAAEFGILNPTRLPILGRISRRH